ncbi:DUF962 domain-containing protein [Vogesella facilis]|uniref:DUF962 domain-containing protein n=1 Tax=Vogesella facilis TaxID=1655232 RepID=A0ABV7R9Y4_9NEIS
MKTVLQQLVNYACYHRDPRNIRTHFVGIPMIVLAVAGLLARPALAGVSLAHVAVVLLVLYYLWLSRGAYRGLGLCMALCMLLALWGGLRLAALPQAAWLGWSLGLFVLGWLFQFVGHLYEGRKPAFVDDLMGLVIGPLFVVAEWLFLLGALGGMQRQIDAQAGPVRRRAHGPLPH